MGMRTRTRRHSISTGSLANYLDRKPTKFDVGLKMNQTQTTRDAAAAAHNNVMYNRRTHISWRHVDFGLEFVFTAVRVRHGYAGVLLIFDSGFILDPYSPRGASQRYAEYQCYVIVRVCSMSSCHMIIYFNIWCLINYTVYRKK